jgi:hypothetical protein
VRLRRFGRQSAVKHERPASSSSRFQDWNPRWSSVRVGTSRKHLSMGSDVDICRDCNGGEDQVKKEMNSVKGMSKVETRSPSRAGRVRCRKISALIPSRNSRRDGCNSNSGTGSPSLYKGIPRSSHSTRGRSAAQYLYKSVDVLSLNPQIIITRPELNHQFSQVRKGGLYIVQPHRPESVRSGRGFGHGGHAVLPEA